MTPTSQVGPPTPEASPHRTAISPVARAVLLAVGTVSLVVGVIGIVLPVLPTTPFLLLAAACYARASTRLYAWLVGQRSLGPIIVEWRRGRALPPGVKTRALVAVAITFAVSLILVDAPAVRVILVATAIVLLSFLGRIPTARPAPTSGTMGVTRPQEEPR